MDDERRAMEAFLGLHARKCRNAPRTRGALLVDYRKQGMPLDTPLVFYTLDDILARFQSTIHEPLLRFLLHRITTLDVDSHVLVGLVFDPKTIFIETLCRNKA